MVYPYVTGRDGGNPNSLPWIVNHASKHITEDIWNTVEEKEFCDTVCYVAVHPEPIIKCFPNYIVRTVLKSNKSQLALNGNTYLWRVQ